jgi:hypothetical protein
MGVDTAILSLIEKVKQRDPSLYDVLKSMASEINDLDLQLNPPVTVTTSTGPTVAVLDDVTNFIYTLTATNVFLAWSRVTDAVLYEIRLGTDWNTANYVVTTGALQVVLDPIATGTTRYLIKALDNSSGTSANAVSVDVVVPTISAVTITPSVIINTVLLNWSLPISSFNIAYYIVKRGGFEVGRITGTFFPYTELSSGSITYEVTPVDIAGNLGLASSVSVTVLGAADFDIISTLRSQFTGLRVNAYVFTDLSITT